MKFEINRASLNDFDKKPAKNAVYVRQKDEWTNPWFIEINTIEELLNLIKDEECEIIVYNDAITIYDYYVE